MPRPRKQGRPGRPRVKESPVDIVARWKRESAEIKERLRARRQELAAELALVDQALADLGARETPPVPALHALASEEPPARAARPEAAARKPRVRGPAGEVPRLLQELRPFWDATLSPRQREIVGLRAAGKMPEEISKQLDIDYNATKNILFRSKGLLMAARERADKPAAEKPASDGEEEEPAPAIDWALLGADGAGYVGPENEAEAGELKISEPDPQPAKVASPRPGRGHGVRHCRRCGQAGHNTAGCTLDESDLAAARVQDIAAACVRLGLSPAPPPPSPLPVVAPPEPSPVERPTWDREDLDAIAAMMPDLPDPPPPPPPVPEPAQEERMVRVSDIKNRHRSRTMRSPTRLTREERRAGEQIESPEEIEMPRTRAECQQDPERPCPWVRCRAHLYLDVNPETGAIKLNFPHLEVWEMKETCSNDAADRGPHTLEEVGALVNLTRERVRQIEVGAGKNREAQKIADGVEFVEQEESPLGAAIG